ncbi:hypothetical protein LPJ70_000243 [Coemansia sp. RSA 2708]|nr:hypothetical protein LPJ70_000243 [Coemansia sp. RSA 2708]
MPEPSNPAKRSRINPLPEPLARRAVTTDGGLRQKSQWVELYETQRELYLKHKELADKAAEKMHQAALMMSRVDSAAMTRESSPSSEMSPELGCGRHAGLANALRSAVDGVGRMSGTDSSSLPDAQSLIASRQGNPDALGINEPYSASVSNRACFPSPSSTDEVCHGGDLGILGLDNPAQPYRFATRLLDAFKLKPRAALTCHFEGADSGLSVAYGMDGTVQLWSPRERRLLQRMGSSALGADFVEHLTQVLPSLLVAVSGERSKPDSLRNSGQLVFLNQAAPDHSGHPQLQGAQQLGLPVDMDRIAVAEGMPGALASDHDRGLLLTGGVRDRKVLIWSLQKTGDRVTAVKKQQLIKTRHTSRISALCYEPFHNYVLSGSDSGRVNVNCAETGREITVDSGEKVVPNVIGKLAVCPTDSNLVLASMGTTKDQLRLFDIREKLSIQRPALVLGQQRERTQSRYIRPAWHPNGNLIFYPFLRGSSEMSSDGMVAIWDVRYRRCADDAPQVYHPHKAGVWSVSFVESRNAGQQTMVTVGNDHCIGFTEFLV